MKRLFIYSRRSSRRGFTPLEKARRKTPFLTGFTLIEVLIATSIFAVVMSTIFSAFHSGLLGHQNIDESINTHQAAMRVLQRINLDLRNSFSYSQEFSKFTGEKNHISFLTLVDRFSADDIIQDYVFVDYKIKENRLMRLCRKNKESLNDKIAAEPEEMASNIEEINFSYGALVAESGIIEWKDSWNDVKALPVAVRIKLTIKGKTRQNFERTIFLPA